MLFLTVGEAPIRAYETVVSGSNLATLPQSVNEALPLHTAATVRTRIVMDSDWDQQIPETPVMWLAGFGTDAHGPPSALAVTFSPATSGWFGPIWGLQLTSGVGLLQDGPDVVESSPLLKGNDYIVLSHLSFQPDREYEVTLGYDPATGATAVSVIDVIGGRSIVSRNIQLQPYAGDLYAGAFVGVVELDKPHVSIVAFDTWDYVDPVKPYWYVMQNDEPGGYFYPVERVDRRRDTQLSIALNGVNFQGEVALSVTNANGIEVERVPYDPSDQPVPLNMSGLMAGSYVASLLYVDGNRVSIVDKKEFSVGVIDMYVEDMHVTPVADETVYVSGTLRVESDGFFGDVAVLIEGSKIRHTFDYDPLTGKADFRRRTEESAAIAPPYVLDVQSKKSLRFDAELVWPHDGEPFSADINRLHAPHFWELIIRPVADVPSYLVGKEVAYNTWLGALEPYVPTLPFLQNEIRTVQSVAPGIDLVQMKGRIPAGPIELHLVIADLTEDGVDIGALVGADLKTPDTSRWPRSVPTQLVENAGAVVGVNGDFFDIRHSMIPRGIVMQGGELLKAGSTGYVTLGVSTHGAPYVGYWRWEGRLTKVGNHEEYSPYHRVEGVNVAQTGRGISVFRSPATWTVGTVSPLRPVVELIVEEVPSDWGTLRGIVREIRQGQPKTEVLPGHFVLAGEGQHGKDLLNMLDVGDVAEVSYELIGETEWPYLDGWTDLRDTVSGNVLLLRNGMYGNHGMIMSDMHRHPRTAVGISWDQQVLYVLLVDGRSARSVGMTYEEMAQFFRYVGAFHALNLDGGGSSGLAVRDRLTNTVRIMNVPSDGRQRYVPNGLGIFYTHP